MQYQDFAEIGPCGGIITFRIRCEEAGQRSFAIGFRFVRPVPASFVGVYALLATGMPVGDFLIGGTGQENRPACPEGAIPVFFGCDSGRMWGHRCPRCAGDFRSGTHPSLWPLTCPYCYLIAPAFHFLTRRHRAYFEHYVTVLGAALDEDMDPGAERVVEIDMDAIVEQDAELPKPEFYYAAEAQQTQYKCEACGVGNDIRGRFGNCSCCGTRNNRAATSDVLEALRAEMNAGRVSPSDAVRSAVSAFDACCRDLTARVAERIPMRSNRRTEMQRALFHDLDAQIVADLKARFDIDLLRGMDRDAAFLRRMFARRHVYEHNGGVADAIYIQKSGDQGVREGDLISEDQGSVNDLIGKLSRIIGNYDRDLKEIFAPTEMPVRMHSERQERVRGAQAR